MPTGLYLFKKLLQDDSMDLSKQQALNTNLKVIQQNNITGNLDQAEQTGMYFITEEEKESILNLSEGTVKLLQFYLTCYKMMQYNTLNVKLSDLQLKIQIKIRNKKWHSSNFKTFIECGRLFLRSG